MEKVRFACPRCQTIMQTGSDKIGYDVACPQCTHRFKLVETRNQEPERTLPPSKASTAFNDDSTIAPTNLANQSTGTSSVPATPQQPPQQAKNSGVSNYDPYNAPGTAQVLGPAIETTSRSFQCPYCQTSRPPRWKSEVSQTGWLVFVVLLLTTCFFCFIGLFIRDKYRECSKCKIRLG